MKIFIKYDENLINKRLYYCNRCYHVKNSLSDVENTFVGKGSSLAIEEKKEEGFKQARIFFHDFILKRLKIKNKNSSNFISDKDINILNIKDIDTIILDKLTEVNKYFNCISLSFLFNPSFFTKHNCIKNNLTKYEIEVITKENDLMDIIILNNILSEVDNPNDILKLCKELCYKDTIIFSMNNTDFNRNSNQFFNTNSFKLLCEKNNFTILNVEDNLNYKFFEIKYQNQMLNSKSMPSISLIESLYFDILKDKFCDYNYT